MKKRVHIQINCESEFIKNGRLTEGAVKWRFLDGMHMFSNSSWVIEQEDMQKLNINCIKNTVSLQDKKIYRYPKLDLPRQKVDLLKEKFNCKVIRDVKKADISIVSKKLMESLISRNWSKSYSHLETYTILKELKEADLLSDSALSILRDFLSNIDNTYRVTFDYNKVWNTADPVALKIYDFISSLLHKYDKDQYDWILDKESYAMYDNLTSFTGGIILDTDVCSIIDEDLAVLKNESFEEVKKMITSSDIDNRSLGLEMLANCNIEKSFDVVSGIYYWHYDWLKDTTNWNTVNVKTFRKRMKAYEGNHCTQSIYSFNNFLNQLAKDNKLTKFAVDATREKFLSTFLSSSVGPNASVFKVDLESLYINDELTNKIILND